ncbi:MAG: TonB family protein [Rhodocyclaceae bacterium]|nr:TonB family protein [Rhodocyclaceae bacterium]
MTEAATHFYAPVEMPETSGARRTLSLVGIALLHVALIALIGIAATRPEIQEPVRALAVRLLETTPPAPPSIEPPKPLPQQAAPKKVLKPPPVLAANRSTDAPAAFAVAPQPEPVAAQVVLAPAPVPVTAARFDADYLQNPKPVYPPMSRRLNEEGKVILRVKVSRDGHPLAVEIKQSSGYPRLDEAARNAVERWRFVPARQGDQAIEAAVLVPLNFTLNS